MEAIRSKKRGGGGIPLLLALFLTLRLALVSPPAKAGVGVWVKAPGDLPSTWEPDFLIAKFAVFGRKGNVRFVWDQSSAKAYCAFAKPVIGWVTHRLSKGEVLGEKTARTIAAKIEGHPHRRCLAGIELNIEPLTTVPQWFVRFLEVFKSAVKLPVHLAVPPVFEAPMPGFHWTAPEMEQVLGKLDGVDFMFYDMGLEWKEYTSVLENSLRFAQEALKKNPTKQILAGLPVYHDKTALHPLEVENIFRLSDYFRTQSFKKFRPLFCNKRLHFGYYAGWTAKSEEIAAAKSLEVWRKDACL